jgi:hypothetical protein
VLLDEVVTIAHSAPDPPKELPLNAPFEKVVRVWRELASPSETAMSDLLQQHEPPAIVQCQDQPHDKPPDQPQRQRPGQHADGCQPPP